MIIGYLKVQLSKDGIHSGGLGIVRDSFDIVRALLDQTGSTKDNRTLDDLQVEVPKEHLQFVYECDGVSPQIECKDDKQKLCTYVCNSYPRFNRW